MRKLALLMLGLIGNHLLSAQINCGEEAFETYWALKEADFSDPQKSPLEAEDFDAFKGISRFDYNPDWCVTARFEKIDRSKPFRIEATGAIRNTYQKVGMLSFTIDGDSLSLGVFRNLDLARNPQFANYLFLPFTDESNGIETYGGGRYLDLEGPLSEMVEIDFNRAYNPYCAYNSKYSCPIPPAENRLKMSVLAGAKPFDH